KWETGTIQPFAITTWARYWSRGNPSARRTLRQQLDRLAACGAIVFEEALAGGPAGAKGGCVSICAYFELVHVREPSRGQRATVFDRPAFADKPSRGDRAGRSAP